MRPASCRIRPRCYHPRSLWRQRAVGGSRQRHRPRSSKDLRATMISPGSSCSTRVWRSSSKTAFVRDHSSWVTPCLSSAWRPHTCVPTTMPQRTSNLFLRAMSAFVEATYGVHLAAFRRARLLADLRHPHKWFPVARQMTRHWRIHVCPTNSGKTHAAAQRMLATPPGMYMGPLRLLAWEMYEKMQGACLRCALRTGQESECAPPFSTHCLPVRV